jgi:hypothetical protein
MKPTLFLLILLLWGTTAQARVVLLYVDNPAGPKVRAATLDEAKRLDEATDPVLIEKTDVDPCPVPITQALLRFQNHRPSRKFRAPPASARYRNDYPRAFDQAEARGE